MTIICFVSATKPIYEISLTQHGSKSCLLYKGSSCFFDCYDPNFWDIRTVSLLTINKVSYFHAVGGNAGFIYLSLPNIQEGKKLETFFNSSSGGDQWNDTVTADFTHKPYQLCSSAGCCSGLPLSCEIDGVNHEIYQDEFGTWGFSLITQDGKYSEGPLNTINGYGTLSWEVNTDSPFAGTFSIVQVN